MCRDVHARPIAIWFELWVLTQDSGGSSASTIRPLSQPRMLVMFPEIPGAHLAPPVPAGLVALLCDLAVDRGISRAVLLGRSGLSSVELAAPKALVPAERYAVLIHEVMSLTGDPCFGLELGLHVPPTMFGLLGMALISADTLEEAVEVGVRYAPLGSRFVDIQLHRVSDGVHIRVTSKMPLGFAHQFALESTLAAWLNCARYLAGKVSPTNQMTTARLFFRWERPPAFGRYEKLLPPTHFGADHDGLFIPECFLRQRPRLAQPLAALQAREWCESELGRVRRSEESFAASVAEALSVSKDGFASLPRVAEHMKLSSRTLARRLERQGVSFRDLVNERKRLEAMALLKVPSLRIDDIAAQLGYVNPANFTRAFKRWTGEPPSAYRRRIMLGDPSAMP